MFILIRRPQALLSILYIALFSATGCQKDASQPHPPPHAEIAQSHPIKKEALIVVPEAARVTWKAVRITITDKNQNRESTYTIPIGNSVSVPGTAMKIEVESFLPAFIMQGSVMTSDSNELRNPAAKVKITENSAVIYRGWLFSRHPNAHAFMHPVYGFTLTDILPRK